MEFVPGARNVKIQYNNKPYRVQIPRMTVSRENKNYGYVDMIVTSPEFIDFWRDLEIRAKQYATHDWYSALDGNNFSVKMDDKTHVFGNDSKLIDPPESLVGETITCILEIKSVYNFKFNNGITCRIHQMKIHKRECLL